MACFICGVFFWINNLFGIRVIPNRKKYPTAYRLYMELLKRYAFYLPYLIHGPNYPKYELFVLSFTSFFLFKLLLLGNSKF